MSTATDKPNGSASIVTNWYKAWLGYVPDGVPTERELRQAAGLLADHGEETVKALVRILVQIMKVEWPDAKRFGSIFAYVKQAVDIHSAESRQRVRVEQRVEKRRVESQASVAAKAQTATMKQVWAGLGPEIQERIRKFVAERHPSIAGHERAVLDMCLAALVSPGLSAFIGGS